MTTPNQPNQPPASGSTPPNPNPSPAGSTEPPPAPAAPSSPFSMLSAEEKDRMLMQQAATIRESARRQAELESRMSALDKKVSTPPVDANATNKEFFSTPVDVIRRELKETVQPLIDFRDEFKKQGAYESLKRDVKADPRFKDFLALPGVETQIDQMMESNPATHESMMAVIAGVRGAMELGLLPKPAGSMPSAPAGGAPQSRGMETPPHLRPSAPPVPEPDSGKKAAVRPLTENEKRLARENRMSDEDYLAWIDTEALDVVSSEIGKKPKEGATK